MALFLDGLCRDVRQSGRATVLAWLVPAFCLALSIHEARGEDGNTWMRQAAHVFRPVAQDADLPVMLLPGVLSEDGQGFLWLGGETGLMRWDGYALRIYAPDLRRSDTLRDQFIQCMHRDPQGRLWVGTVADGLARLDATQDRFQMILREKLTGNARHIWSIDDDGSGGLWLGTGAGLFHIDAYATALTQVSLPRTLPAGLAADAVFAVLRDKEGILWVGTQHGLARGVASNTRFEAVMLTSEARSDIAVSRLMQDQAGRIWVGTRQKGAFVVDVGRNAAKSVEATASNGHATVATEITALLEVAQDRVWMGTYGNGILEVVAGDVQHPTWIKHRADVPYSLPDDSIQGLYRDRSGLVWVGTSQGLSQTTTDQKAVQTIFGDPLRKDGLTATSVMSVLAQPDGSLWAGSEGTGYDVLLKSGAKTGQLPGRRVFALANGPAGGVLIGTDGGLYWADQQGKPKGKLTIPDYAGEEDVRALSVLNGTIWLGSRNNGLWQLAMASNGELSLTNHWDARRIGGDRVMAIAQMVDGGVAVGVEDGFSLINPRDGTVEHVHSDPADAASLGPGSVVSFLTDRAGRLWVGTSDSGINVMEGRDASSGHLRFRHVGVTEGLPNADIGRMLLDRAGNVWASTDNGIAVINSNDLSVRALRRADGVAINAYWVGAGDVTNDGALVFGGIGGITVAYPELTKPWRYVPAVAVTGVRLGGKEVAFRTDNGSQGAKKPALIVPPRVNSLAVEFVALDYSAPERNRYRYRLDGFDQDWIETDAKHRVATYTGLPPGDFTLRISGSNRDGFWANNETLLSIRVLPAWYQTVSFKLLAGGSVGLIVCAAAYAWSYMARQRQRELTRQVADRTAELSASQKQLEQYAYVDTMTGLHNRRAFNEKVHTMIEEARSGSCQFALVLIDLDNFKQVNDIFGHDAGDALLVETSRRLREIVREGDFVSRLGGDEFAVLLRNIRDLEIVEKLCSRIVEALGAPTTIRATLMQAGASVGVGLFPDHGTTQEDLYRHVDQALYEAKRAGRGAWQWYGDGRLRIVT